jgi:hypothetical protein
LDTVISGVVTRIAKVAERKESDPDIAFEQFVGDVRAGFARGGIAPLLDRMEGFFERTEDKPVSR